MILRLLSRFLVVALTALGVGAAAWVAVELLSTLPPPARTSSATDGTGLRLSRGGQHLLLLRGSPYALGFHNARLASDLLRRQEDTLLDLLFGFARGPAKAMLVRQLSLFYLTGLDRYLTDAERQEILGLAEGTADPFPDLGPRYTRLTAYHAIHELSQRFATDSPTFACSLLAVSGARTADGHALVMRNFDFEGGEVFDRDKTVVVVRPQTGLGHVSVAWAGMAGVVSGINAAGLVVTINAGASADYRRVGAPTSLLVRRALEGAATIDAAVRILTATPRFVTDIIGLADASGAVAVLELLPERFALRRGDVLVATNHLEAPAFAADPVNETRRCQTTTAVRHDRLDRLVAEHPGTSWTVADLLRVSRDRRAADGAPLPLGHRHAIDALIATHAVIFDAAAKQLWVSAGPHTLGPYHGYDVQALLQAVDRSTAAAAYLPSLPEDPLVARYPQIAAARLAWQTTRQALEAGDLATAAARLPQTAALANHPTTLTLQAELAHAARDDDAAREFLHRALAAPPEFPEATRGITELEAGLAPVRGAGRAP
ncbi:MAG: hypothetical protein HY903_10930 [Deltaproteobacteria bacterium]|nr:hypothetical protein [Deltaproteobacteria bacterium]